MTGVTLKQITFRISFVEDPTRNTIWGILGAKDKCALTEGMNLGDAFNLLSDWVHQQTYAIETGETQAGGRTNIANRHVYLMYVVIEVPDKE
ncbi:hypothetical protein KBA63_02310 [Candidatus Woesebacteria bacterium]|jgi:hypothetical protein|nr:hypothetical protein [Candidatus Woesebacteria bacterium]MBP9687195.1 hypothetical protein [Candidatus Woesebacteria bacterium]